MTRRSARLAAVQALYQIEMTGVAPDAVVMEFQKHWLAGREHRRKIVAADAGLFARLVKGVTGQTRRLDDLIAGALSKEWAVDRLETVLKVVLRAGAYELAVDRDVPARTVINEYVEVADAFLARKETGLVNGVLDRLGRALRADEIDGAPVAAEPPAG